MGFFVQDGYPYFTLGQVLATAVTAVGVLLAPSAISGVTVRLILVSLNCNLFLMGKKSPACFSHGWVPETGLSVPTVKGGQR